ncbi:MAG TPA: N-acetylglucosamine-6-phosphate deacetylase [Lachnospiraceae bacterium]
MIIKNALVYRADGHFVKEDIFIKNERFVEEYIPEEGEKVVDAEGCYAIPGLIDIHFHGAVGYDICDGSMEAYEKIADYELENGITSICPATLTLPVEELLHVLKTGAEFAKQSKGADLVGFNMEGPFISYEKKGAQNEKYIKGCDEELVDEFLRASEGLVKFVGLAPERNEDFENYIRKVKGKIRVSLAHTNAKYDLAKKALDAGACHGVHLYNAMSGFSHRDTGVVGALSDSPHAFCEIICDGIHVTPSAVRAAMRLMGKDRMVLVSDSLRSTGMPDGIYMLGGQEVEKKGSSCCLVKGGNLAGSVTNLRDCMKNVVKTMEIPLETAIQCATLNAAKSIGIDKDYGSIEIGKFADVVLLKQSEDLDLVGVIKRGREVKKSLRP